MSDARNWSAVMAALNSLDKRVETLEKVERPITASSTYTPTMIGETTAGATTYTTQNGQYTQIGNIIFAWGYVVWTAATGTGNMIISLPFARNNANIVMPVTLYVDGITFASGAPMGAVVPGAAYFRLYYPASNAATTVIAVEAAGQVGFTAVYALT